MDVTHYYGSLCGASKVDVVFFKDSVTCPDCLKLIHGPPEPEIAPSAPSGTPCEARLEQMETVLRNLASVYGAGGYNAAEVKPHVFEAKIYSGVDTIVRVETGRREAAEARLKELRGRIEAYTKRYGEADAGAVVLTAEVVHALRRLLEDQP